MLVDHVIRREKVFALFFFFAFMRISCFTFVLILHHNLFSSKGGKENGNISYLFHWQLFMQITFLSVFFSLLEHG